MSGHSKWSKVKHKKGPADQKRGQLFSKLLNTISIAARRDSNPQFNPRLRSAIEKARENNVPNENIERAISGASETKELEEITIEAYGPEKVAMIIEGATDNKNRTISEIKHLLNENNAKMADPGSVLWSFEKQNGEWKAKFPREISKSAKQKLIELVSRLEEREDVQKVITNTN